MTRITRTKVRINALVESIVNILNTYPELSINAVATAADWTQSSFQRALESREQVESIIERTGRLSVKDLVAQYAMERDYQQVDAILDAIEATTALQTAPESELPGYVEPAAEVEPEETEVEDEADDDEDEDYTNTDEDDDSFL